MANSNYTTREQLHKALEQYLDAHTKASDAAAAYVELKAVVGGNETERKAAKARMPADEYDGYLAHYAECEHIKVTAAAAAERAEKVLNVLRELLNNETAVLSNEAVKLQAEVAGVFHQVAQTNYTTVSMQTKRTADKPTLAEIRAHTNGPKQPNKDDGDAALQLAPPARPIVMRQFDPNEPPPF